MNQITNLLVFTLFILEIVIVAVSVTAYISYIITKHNKG